MKCFFGTMQNTFATKTGKSSAFPFEILDEHLLGD
jgi:hypothetical protein